MQLWNENEDQFKKEGKMLLMINVAKSNNPFDVYESPALWSNPPFWIEQGWSNF